MRRLLVVVVLLAACGTDSESGVTTEQFKAWRAECSARATIEIQQSDGLYRVGGNHWVDAVNDCMLAKARD